MWLSADGTSIQTTLQTRQTPPQTHNARQGAKYTRARLPPGQTLSLYSEAFASKPEAMRHEASLRKMREKQPISKFWKNNRVFLISSGKTLFSMGSFHCLFITLYGPTARFFTHLEGGSRRLLPTIFRSPPHYSFLKDLRLKNS